MWEFLQARDQRTSWKPNRVMESSFEPTKPYVLTELGRQFVHYVMEDVVPQIGNAPDNSPTI